MAACIAVFFCSKFQPMKTNKFIFYTIAGTIAASYLWEIVIKPRLSTTQEN